MELPILNTTRACLTQFRKRCLKLRLVSTRVKAAPANVGSVGNVGILENFSGEILWGLFGFAYIAYIPYTIISLL